MLSVTPQRTEVVDHVREAIAQILPTALARGVRPGIMVEDGLPSGLDVDDAFVDELASCMDDIIAERAPERLVVRVLQRGLDDGHKIRMSFEIREPPRVLGTVERSWSIARRSPMSEVQGSLPPGHWVFVVDDEPVTRRLMRHVLGQVGAEVMTFSSGDAVIERLAAGGPHPDLCFMDMSMPGLSGIETVQAMRDMGISTPIIGLSANRFAQERRACVQAGMDDYMSKPVIPLLVHRLVARWMARANESGAAA